MLALRFKPLVGAFLWLGQLLTQSAAAAPVLLPHQGRMAVGEAYFEGNGAFKFALLNADATTLYWLNAPDHNLDGEPDAAVTLPVQRGLYSVLLGDTSQVNMAPLEASVFRQPELYLRVWFDDGVHGFERLAPDQRVVSPPYALTAGDVPDGAITTAKLAPTVLQPLQAQLAALAAELVTLSNRLGSLEDGVRAGLPPGVPVLSPRPDDPALLADGFLPVLDQAAPGWVAGAIAGEAAPRFGHSAVWTGSEMWVWGGTLPNFVPTASGARYRPDADAWSPLALVGAPSPRSGHGAVWTGQELIVWGGLGEGEFRNTGARLAPGASVWTALPLAGAPAGRSEHVMVWTGKYVVVWGGRNSSGLLADGALYDPAVNQWKDLIAPGPAPFARHGAAAVWTGDSLIVWGGQGLGGELDTGARLRFSAAGEPQAWESMSPTGAPRARTGHSAVWTGQFMIIWGGQVNAGLLNDGGRYDPTTGAWQALSTLQAPAPRQHHNAVWTGREMLILGGQTEAAHVPPLPHAYAPASNSWRPLSLAGNPPARALATAVWTGTEVLHFGGRSGSTTLAALYRLNPRPAWFFYLKP